MGKMHRTVERDRPLLEEYDRMRREAGLVVPQRRKLT